VIVPAARARSRIGQAIAGALGGEQRADALEHRRGVRRGLGETRPLACTGFAKRLMALVPRGAATEPKTATRFGAGRLEAEGSTLGLLSIVARSLAAVALRKP
jgi:hypothetical protein